MTPRTELDRLFAEALAKIPTPDAVEPEPEDDTQ